MSLAPDKSDGMTASQNVAGWKRPIGRLWSYLSERVGIDAMLALGMKKKVPIHRSSIFYFLGGMALFLFGIQVVTGILLSLYYKPSTDQAFESVRAIMTEVEFGWLIRSIHSWGANLVVGVLFLHLLTVYMMRAYRRPREFTWVTGVLLLGIFMAFGFSGYLLPWNELSFFATRVGTALAGKVPLIGDQLLLLARGGQDVTGDTLSRLYAVHVAILPLVTCGLVGAHLYLVQKQGMSSPESVILAQGGEDKVRSMPFVPHFLLRDAVGWYLALALLAALAALFPWELGQKADPFGSAPVGIKPEWYFLFMFQALKQLPPECLGLEGETLGVLFFGGVGAIILVVPFVDRWPFTRRILNVLATLSVMFFIFMTAWGFFDTAGRRVMLGTGLSVGMLMLGILSSNRPGWMRSALWILLAFFAGVFMFSIADGALDLGVWDRVGALWKPVG